MRVFQLLGALVSVAAPCAAQFVTPPAADSFTVVKGPQGTQVRFRQVPTGPGSICELNANVKSYAGFVDIAPHQHIFFWFFESRQVPPSQAPLTAWISGGPGAASLSELFTEHGPCKVDEDFNVRTNPYSWSSFSNMVYIDQPTQVGFSYSDPIPGYIDQDDCTITKLSGSKCPADQQGENDCDAWGIDICGTFSNPIRRYTANSTDNAAVSFWLALQGIFAALPQYTKNGFQFGGESYAGHYVPIFSRYIEQQNSNLPSGAVKIPLQNVFITNGWLDPQVGYPSHYSYAVSPGNTYGVKFQSKAAETRMKNAVYGPNHCLDLLKQCNSPSGNDDNCQTASNYCTDNVQQLFERQTGRDEYDIRQKAPAANPPGFYINYLNSDRVQKALGVFTNYTDLAPIVGVTFDSTGDDARELGLISALATLLNSGIGVSLVYGDADYNSNWFGGQISAQHVADSTKSGDGGRLSSAYNSAGFQNITTSDGKVHGQVKQAGRFSFVRVYQAGHQVGFFQPLVDQALFNRTIHAQDLATGLQNVTPGGTVCYKSTGQLNSTYVEGSVRTLPNQKRSPSVKRASSSTPVDTSCDDGVERTTSDSSTVPVQWKLLLLWQLSFSLSLLI